MSELVTRDVWVDPRFPVTGSPARLAMVDEIVVHCPGVPAGALNLADPVGVLRATHRYYLGKKPNGYSIGYNFATFPAGRWECRGFQFQNAANLANDDGIPDNAHTLSVNVMVNGADEATPSQVLHTRAMVAHIWQVLGRQVPLVGHGDVPGANTACPGAGIRAQLRAGVFLPQTEELDMSKPMHIVCTDRPELGEALWLDGRFIGFTSPAQRDVLLAAQSDHVLVAVDAEQFMVLAHAGGWA